MVAVMPAKAPSLYPSQDRLLRALGVRLREARLRRRFTVVQVAERAAVSRPTLNKVEQGDPSVTLGTYLRVLTVPRRAPKRRQPTSGTDERSIGVVAGPEGGDGQ